jgi:fumarylacetoacetase
MSFAEHFSIANIPYGIATTNSNTKPSVVTRLEDTVIFLHVLAESGLLSDLSGQVLASFAQVRYVSN